FDVSHTGRRTRRLDGCIHQGDRTRKAALAQTARKLLLERAGDAYTRPRHEGKRAPDCSREGAPAANGACRVAPQVQRRQLIAADHQPRPPNALARRDSGITRVRARWNLFTRAWLFDRGHHLQEVSMLKALSLAAVMCIALSAPAFAQGRILASVPQGVMTVTD